MKVTISKDQLTELEIIAKQAFPNEACALLIGHGESVSDLCITQVKPAKNVTKCDSKDSFEIDPLVYFSVAREVRGTENKVIGVWHSHPNGLSKPSDADSRHSLEPSWVWLITALDSCDAKAETKAYQAELANPSIFQPCEIIFS